MKTGPRAALVMGLGRFGGGLGVVRWLFAKGYAVTVTDLASEAALADTLGELTDVERAALTLRLGEHRTEDFVAADLVVVNPAVPPNAPHLVHARAAGARVTSEVELFLEHVPRATPLALITGTQGKSSTANLLAGALAGAGLDVTLAGNIGRSLLGELAGRSATTPGGPLVAELSSYQLEALPAEDTHLAQADVVVITNLLVDHLARHGTPEAYHRAKLRILDRCAPGGLALLPASLTEAALTPLLTPAQAARIAGGDLHIERFQDTAATDTAPAYRIGPGTFQGPAGPLAALDDLRLPGDFQRHNALAALAAARALTPEVLDLTGVRGLVHRNEPLGHFGPHGTLVVDNGVSTTPDSTLAAIQALDGPVVLLAGGQPKNLPLDGLVRAGAPHLARVLTFGAAAEDFAQAFIQGGVASEVCSSVDEAVERAFAGLGPGETLLFSPAAASFDAYSNFAQRAAAFRAALPPRRTAPFAL